VTAVADEPDELDEDKTNGLSAYLRSRTWRHDEAHLCTRLDLRPDLVDAGGALRLGAIVFAADAATGIQSGLAVLDDDLWIVTTDLSVVLAEPVTVGPVRIDTEVVRVGATTVVATLEAWDEGAGRRVGAGTATGRPFSFDFDRRYLDFPIGVELTHGDFVPPTDVPLAERVGFRPVGEDGSMEVALRPWLLNPWGILHGGATACLVEEAALAAASAGSGRPARAHSALLRYLAPGRAGPMQARPRVHASAGGRHVVQVEVRDLGNRGGDDRGRLCSVATVEAVDLD